LLPKTAQAAKTAIQEAQEAAAAYGRMCAGKADNDGRMDGGEPAKPLKADIRELESVGIPPQDGY
jgi:hypothetical protein